MNNPLKEFYRTRIAEAHISLPSDGKYGGDVDFNIENTVAVYAMTGKDEVFITNPEALISGTAVQHLINSCCPSIRDVKNLPVQDVDVICLVSKKLSYGNNIILSGNCEKCEHEQKFKINIDDILIKSKKLPEEMICIIDDIPDLKIYLKPYTLELSNFISSKEFEERKFVEILNTQTTDSEQQAKNFFDSVQKIKNLSLGTISKCINKIETPTGEVVVDDDYISDFINNAPLKYIKQITKKLSEFGDYGLPNTYSVKCEKCEHSQEIPLVYDPTSFFE